MKRPFYKHVGFWLWIVGSIGAGACKTLGHMPWGPFLGGVVCICVATLGYNSWNEDGAPSVLERSKNHPAAPVSQTPPTP